MDLNIDAAKKKSLFNRYEEKKKLLPYYENVVDTKKYEDNKELKCTTSHFLGDKKLLIMASSYATTDDRKGNVTERLKEVRKKFTVVFEYNKQKVIATVQLPNTVVTSEPIEDDKLKQLIIDEVKKVNNTNDIFTKTLIYYENLIQNLKHTIDLHEEDNAVQEDSMQPDKNTNIKLYGKHMVKARLAQEKEIGQTIMVKENDNIVEKQIKPGDIITVRVDADKTPILDDDAEKIKDVLSKEEFNEMYEEFFPTQEYYVTKKTLVFIDINTKPFSQTKEQLKINSNGFDTKINLKDDCSVHLPYDPSDSLSFKDNIIKFAEKLKSIRTDYTNLPNLAICRSNGIFIDPDMRKLFGQTLEINNKEENVLKYKPSNDDFR